MNDPRIMQMFADVGAIVSESHFVYSSGRHSSVYINKDALYLHTQTISALCQLMASPYSTEQVDAVVGPVWRKCYRVERVVQSRQCPACRCGRCCGTRAGDDRA